MNLTPFLLVDGNCAEGMAFYQSCLGGELTITRLGNTAMGDQASLADRYGVHWFVRGAPRGAATADE